MNNKNSNGYPSPRWKPPYERSGGNRSAEIKRFADAKEVSIVVTSAMNNAFHWCSNHPLWQTEMSEDKRLEWVDETARKLIAYTAEKRPEFESLYDRLVSGKGITDFGGEE